LPQEDKVIYMKVQVLKKKGNTMVFVLDGVTPAFANALRRIMISEVPTLAVEWVDFHSNSSILFDEVISHRMGLIPLVFDPKKFNRKEDCKCGGKGCPLCEVVFAVDKRGPAIVYSGDLKSSNRTVKPTSPAFPIAELLKNQDLKFEAKAEIGTGRQHAKWQAANAAYQYYPELEVSKDATPAGIKNAVSLCPKEVLVVKAGKLVMSDPAGCDLCLKCDQAGEGIRMNANPSKFIFRVETISGLSPADIVEQAAEILSSKGEEFKKNAAKL
jgi:DNA-directed RNA polymerase subunit D